MTTTAPSQPTYSIRWIPQAVENLLHNHNILTRGELARELNIPRSTVYDTFDADWSGEASIKMLAVLAGHFQVPISRLVTEPAVQAARSRARRVPVRRAG